MGKKRVNITIDEEVHEAAKKEGFNISKVCENALKRKVELLRKGKAVEKSNVSSDVDISENSNEGKVVGPEGVEPSTSTMSSWKNSIKRAESVKQSDEGFLEDFKETCTVDWGLAESTVRERMRYAKKLVNFLNGHPLKADKSQLRNFIQKFDDDNAIKTVRVVYGRYFDSKIADSFKVPQPQPKPKHVPDKSELQKVYEELEYPQTRTAFLILGSSGLRRHELMELTPSQIDFENRIIYSKDGATQTTKRQWITLYNDEAENQLEKEINLKGLEPDTKLFDFNPDTLTTKFREASKKANTSKITPQVLRVWFCNEMNHLGVADRHIDAYCGRVPKSVLAKHYTDFSPDRLKEIYEKAGIKVLEGD